MIFLLPPIVSCIILAGILSYFGNHILTRGIVFIDIAVAQIAALGTMIGILLGFAEGSVSTQLISYALQYNYPGSIFSDESKKPGIAPGSYNRYFLLCCPGTGTPACRENPRWIKLHYQNNYR